MGGEVHHLFEGLGGLVEAAQLVKEQAFVETGLQGVGVLLAGLADGDQRILILALAALNFSDVDQGLSVLGIGLGQQLELLQGFVELVVGSAWPRASRVWASSGSMSAAR